MSGSCGAIARPSSAKLRETLEVGDSDQIVQLRDGTKALIRPIGPSDRQRLKEGFESSSDESRFLRFLAPVPELSSRQLNYLTDVDHDHHEALIAVDPETGASFGTARYVRRDDDPKTAEVAVGVGDRWMRIGLGTALMNALVRRAREVGVVRITAVIHAENTAAKALLAKVAGPAGSRSRAAGWGVKESVVDLESERLDAKRSQLLDPYLGGGAMNTLQLSSFGEPTDVVELAEIASGEPGPGQLAVAIEAATINPSDLMLIRGVYGVRPQLPAALGAEGVGRVVAVGERVDASRVGERVLVVPTLEQATWRERTILDERNAVPVDADSDPLQLAMLGINPITAHSLLHGYVKLAPGAWVAQTGASSATARYVLALAKHAGLRTLNVVRRADSVKSLLEAGGDVVLVEGDDLADQAVDAIGDAPLELIIDGVAGEPVAQLAPLLKTGGQIVSYTARGRQPLSISILDLIFRGLSVQGYWLNLWLESTPRETVAQTYRELAALVADGTLAAPVEATYALSDYREAIAHAARNDRNGKVLFALG